MELVAADSVASYDVEILSGDAQNAASNTVSWAGDGQSARSPYPATVTLRRELHTPESDRSCLHVELDMQGSQVDIYLLPSHTSTGQIPPRKGALIVHKLQPCICCWEQPAGIGCLVFMSLKRRTEQSGSPKECSTSWQRPPSLPLVVRSQHLAVHGACRQPMKQGTMWAFCPRTRRLS